MDETNDPKSGSATDSDTEVVPPEPVTRRDRQSKRLPPWGPRLIALYFLGLAAFTYGRGVVTALRPLIVVLLVSLFASFAIEPAVNRMETRGIRRGVGTWAVFLVVILAASGFGFAMGAVLADQINEFVDNVPAYLEDLEDWLDGALGIEVDTSELQRDWEEGGVQQYATNFADDLLNWGTTLINLVFQIFTIALFTFYLVAEGPKLRRNVCSFLPAERQREVLELWDLAIEKTGGYIASRAILAAISTVAHAAAFALLDVPFPLPMALWVGLMSQFIPVVGTYIAGALPVAIALLDSPTAGVGAFIVVVAYQQLENYVFGPRITAHTMSLHVATAFGAVIAGAAVLGVVGALLALPAAATAQAFVSTYIQRYDIAEDALDASRRRRKGFRRLRRFGGGANHDQPG